MTSKNWRETPRTARAWYEGYAVLRHDETFHRVQIPDTVGCNIAENWKTLNVIAMNICPAAIIEDAQLPGINVAAFIVFEVVDMNVENVYYWKFGSVMTSMDCCIPLKICVRESNVRFGSNFTESNGFKKLYSIADQIAGIPSFPYTCELAAPHKP